MFSSGYPLTGGDCWIIVNCSMVNGTIYMRSYFLFSLTVEATGHEAGFLFLIVSSSNTLTPSYILTAVCVHSNDYIINDQKLANRKNIANTVKHQGSTTTTDII